MNKNLNGPQVLFTSFFVLIVLAIFSFLVPEFENKSIVFVILGGVSAFIGSILSSRIIKNTN